MPSPLEGINHGRGIMAVERLLQDLRGNRFGFDVGAAGRKLQSTPSSSPIRRLRRPSEPPQNWRTAPRQGRYPRLMFHGRFHSAAERRGTREFLAA
jgi:hypothetical protein